MVSHTRIQANPSQTVGGNATIRQAMALMTEYHQSLLPIVDDAGILIGVVTDGDIRRGLLRNVSLDDAVDVIANRNPVAASDDDEQHEIDRLMRSRNKMCVPVVDRVRRFVRLAFLDRPLIPNCVPCIEGREQAYVAEAVGGGWLAVGPFIERFERHIADFADVKHAVALSNGTAALHLGLVAVGVVPGDLVLMPSLTFAATANAVRYCGAKPMFFDSERDSWCISVAQVAAYLERDCVRRDGGVFDRASGARIGAMMPVHLYGHPADLDPLVALSETYGIPLVEDGAEALGALYKGRMIGSPHRLFALSFNGNKVITSGGGGMLLTNDDALARRLRYLASQAKDDPVEFLHGDIGYNYRMPNINAALALGQAELLPEFIARKRAFVTRYDALLSDIKGVSMWRGANWAESSNWMALLTVDPEQHPGAVERLRRFLPSRGIEARPVWLPLHRQKPYLDCPHQEIRQAEELYANGLCLPCSTGLKSEELAEVAQTIVEFFTLYR